MEELIIRKKLIIRWCYAVVQPGLVLFCLYAIGRRIGAVNIYLEKLIWLPEAMLILIYCVFVALLILTFLERSINKSKKKKPE